MSKLRELRTALCINETGWKEERERRGLYVNKIHHEPSELQVTDPLTCITKLSSYSAVTPSDTRMEGGLMNKEEEGLRRRHLGIKCD
jgi:hypothetical protein